MIKIFLAISVFIIVTGCGSEAPVTDARDYDMFMDPGIPAREQRGLKTELSFWQNRLQKDPGNWVDQLKLGSRYMQLFKLRGLISDYRTGDSLLQSATARLNNTDPDMLFALSQHAITQHRFRDASAFVGLAEQAGGDSYTAHLLGFDTKLELGATVAAERTIGAIREKNSFDYLVRLSKLEDQKGNIEHGVQLMENAFEKIKNSDAGLYCWTLSSLGDMYGHAGRVEDAYKAYLKVLRRDKTYIHALKGIAWIAFSHDHHSDEAKRIYQYILSVCKMPELWLSLAEIAGWEGDEIAKQAYIRRFLDEVEQPGYGNMYNKYLIRLYTEEIKDYNKALRMAEKEIEERATPETYDWLAWVHYSMGNIGEARKIAMNFVYNRNFEPEALLHCAMIFLAGGEKQYAEKLLEECAASLFELGPVKAGQVKKILQQSFL